MTPEDFDALFDAFTATVVRLEMLPAYLVGGTEAERLDAARRGRPRPIRWVRNDPWLARIATSTVLHGKTWTRVRVVDLPLNDYQRDEVTAAFVESQAVGEHILIAERGQVGDGGDDFWLFDRDQPGAHAVVMRYDRDGRWLGADRVDDPSTLTELGSRVDAVAAAAVELNIWLASHDG